MREELMNLEHSCDKPDVFPSTTNINVRFVPPTPLELPIKIMKSNSASNAQPLPSLFQIAAHIEDFAQALAARTVRRLDEMPFAEVIHRWEQQVRGRQTAATVAAPPPPHPAPAPMKRAVRTAAPKNKKTGTNPPPAPPMREPKRIQFSLTAPTAMSVKLAADFTEWENNPLDLTPAPSGVWSVVIALAPGHYAYRYIVDGQWCDDPRSELRAPNPFGTANAVIEVV